MTPDTILEILDQRSMSSKTRQPARHPDLMTADEVCAWMGISSLDRLGDYRPPPLAYNSRLYHRQTVERYIQLAARDGDGAGDTVKVRMAR